MKMNLLDNVPFLRSTRDRKGFVVSSLQVLLF